MISIGIWNEKHCVIIKDALTYGNGLRTIFDIQSIY